MSKASASGSSLSLSGAVDGLKRINRPAIIRMAAIGKGATSVIRPIHVGMAKVRDIARKTQLPVLISPGFVEGRDPITLTDPERTEAYMALLKPYPGAGKVIPLAYLYSSLARPYFEEIATKVLADSDRFLVVARGDARIYQSWLEPKVPGRRIKTESQGNFGRVTVTLFTLTR